jgi:hypothetical protein
MRRTLFAFLLFLVLPVVVLAVEPQRSQGISIQMLPKRIAKISGRPWGLSVDYSPKLKAETVQPVLQTGQELLAYVRKQDSTVQENGVWVVITNPDAYSDEGMRLLEEVESLCREQRVPLFVSRASEVPNGWKRYDQ